MKIRFTLFDLKALKFQDRDEVIMKIVGREIHKKKKRKGGLKNAVIPSIQ